jgi:hypothetical protein
VFAALSKKRGVDVVRHAISLVFALCISSIGGTAFVYMIHAHSGAWRWMYTSAAMLFLTGVMVTYDELFVPWITCPKCRRTSYHPKDIAERYCGACGDHDWIGSK